MTAREYLKEFRQDHPKKVKGLSNDIIELMIGYADHVKSKEKPISEVEQYCGNCQHDTVSSSDPLCKHCMAGKKNNWKLKE